MKPTARLRLFLLASSSLIAASFLHAATLTWDANAATAGQTDGNNGGAAVWLGTDQWWTGTTNQTWVSNSDAVFGNGGAGGAVTLASPTTVSSLNFNYFTGTYTLGTAGQALTVGSGGVTMTGLSGNVTMVSPVTLSGAQTWTNSNANNTGTTLLFNSILTLGGNWTANVAGNSSISFDNASAGIAGTGDVIKNGAGMLVLNTTASPTFSFTGNFILNEGYIGWQTPPSFTSRNMKITGGYVGGRFGSGVTWTNGLGTGNNQIQITGGVSGISGEGNTGSTFTIGTGGSVLKWGASTENSATGFFNPSVFIANGSFRMNSNGKGSLNNSLDLNGTTRTITSLQTTDGAAGSGFTIGAIVNTAGTAAGLTKTGTGNLILSSANTYNDATTISSAGFNTTSGGSITLSGSGTINSTTGLTLNGTGTLRLVNTAQTNRFADGANITSNGGFITYENTSGANVYTETLGSLAANGGQTNIVLATNQADAGSQTLTFGTSGSSNLTQSGTGSVTFSAATTGPQASGNKNMIAVFGSGTSAFLGPWATVGTTAALQTDYAAYNSGYVVPAAIAGSAETTWTVAAAPYTMDFTTAGTSLTATRNVGALRIIGGAPLTSVDTNTETITLTGHTFVDGNTVIFGTGAPGGLTAGTTYFVVSAAIDTFKVSATSGGAAINLTNAGTSPTVVLASATTLALSTGNNLGTLGILNGSPYSISITPGTGGSVTLPTTSAGQLYVTTGSGGITIDAPINNNTGALTLVKNGSGTLLLRAANNAYTGDTIINAGILQIGNTNPGTTGTLNAGAYGGNIYIAGGATMNQFLIGNQTFSGIISGDGNLVVGYTNLTLGNSNTYTGRTSLIPQRASGGGQLNVASFNSVFTDPTLGTVHAAQSSLGAPTTVANGTIQVGNGTAQSGVTLKYTGSGEVTDRIINFAPNNASVTLTLDTSGSGGTGLLKFTSAPVNTGSAAGNLLLQGSTNGEFAQGLPFAFANFTKNGAGTWTLGGAVGNTGTTTISAGTLILNGSKPGSGTVAVNGTSTLGGNGTIAGVVTVAAGANLSPGTSVGTLTFRNDLNISASAGGTGKLNYELGPIVSSDKIAVGGTLTIGPGVLNFADFNFTAISGLQNGTYKLITSGAAVSGTLDTTPANLTGTIGAGPATGTLQISGSGNDIELVVSGVTGGATYSDWATLNGAGSNLSDDHDNDGVDNGTEYFIGGPTGNTTGFTALPGVIDTAGTLSVTWPKASGYTGTYGTHYFVETSETLVGEWTTEIVTPNPGFTVTFPSATEVKYTFPNPLGTKKFARLKVTGP